MPNAPQAISYCHCPDCRRITGAPVAAFAAFAEGALMVTQTPSPKHFTRNGVDRFHCAACGSPIGARFDYLPGQFFVPLGLFDDAASLQPELHSHADHCLPWLHITDDLPREGASARDRLQQAPAKG